MKKHRTIRSLGIAVGAPDARGRPGLFEEFITKLGVPYYCFHDFDLIDEVEVNYETEDEMDELVENANNEIKLAKVGKLNGMNVCNKH